MKNIFFQPKINIEAICCGFYPDLSLKFLGTKNFHLSDNSGHERFARNVRVDIRLMVFQVR